MSPPSTASPRAEGGGAQSSGSSPATCARPGRCSEPRRDERSRAANRAMPRYAIVVHGGCGRWDRGDTRAALSGVRVALEAGRKILAGGGSALDAVCAAVVVLEDDPLFNAGTGSTLTRDGEAVMVGEGLRCGGVAAIRRVKNPILVARKVMEKTSHVLLAGPGALAFARGEGFRDYDPVTVESRQRFRNARLKAAPQGTVGAVA